MIHGDLTLTRAGPIYLCIYYDMIWCGQVLGGGLATKGWLAHGVENRMVAFDAQYLHGACVCRLCVCMCDI